VLRRLGEGSFSTVILARYRADGREYAVKMINKSLVIRNKVGGGGGGAGRPRRRPPRQLGSARGQKRRPWTAHTAGVGTGGARARGAEHGEARVLCAARA
jgi:serine/threonine protein kinase